MTAKEVKKPIGFASWGEEFDEKDIQEKDKTNSSYDDKFCEYG